MNRDYWVMTELFVLLHDGKDHCPHLLGEMANDTK